MPQEFEGMSTDEIKETKEILEEINEEVGTEPDNPDEGAEPEPKEEPAKAEEPEEVKPEEPEVDDTGGEQAKRTPQTVPLPKYMKLRDEMKDLKTELESIKNSNKTPEKKDEDIESLVGSISDELSNELGVDKDKLQGIFGKFANSLVEKSKMPSDINELIQEAKDNRLKSKQEEGFKNELVKLKKDFPNESFDDDKLHELAFNSDYINKSLFEIHFRHLKKDEPSKKKTAESGKPGVSKEKEIDFKNISADEMLEMTDEEFDEYSAALEKGHSSVSIYNDKGQKIK